MTFMKQNIDGNVFNDQILKQVKVSISSVFIISASSIKSYLPLVLLKNFLLELEYETKYILFLPSLN